MPPHPMSTPHAIEQFRSWMVASAAVAQPAEQLVAAAVKTAKADGRVVLIEFVNAPDVNAIVRANYVVLNLTVQEREDKKALENPGRQQVMDSLGGAYATRSRRANCGHCRTNLR
jgi:hypothetical protein